MTIIERKNKIQSIVNVFETGSIKGDYANVSIYNDGPDGVKQVTYGKSQTTEYGNLKKLIEVYAVSGGTKSDALKSYVPKIGATPLHEDKAFITLLKQAGADPVMVKTQDEFFDTHYWNPAIKWADTNKFVLPLSGLVIYDSFIHSGSILTFLRNKFSEKIPANGGSEEAWIKAYLTARKEWLSNHSNPILRKTVYRVNNMLAAVDKKDWQLDEPFNANGVSVA